jgi:hypothetical protein
MTPRLEVRYSLLDGKIDKAESVSFDTGSIWDGTSKPIIGCVTPRQVRNTAEAMAGALPGEPAVHMQLGAERVTCQHCQGHGTLPKNVKVMPVRGDVS